MNKPTFDKITKIWSAPKVPPVFNPNQSLGQLILRVLKLSPEVVAQISADTKVSVTRQQIRERTEKFAKYLNSIGLKQGDNVGIVAANTENLAPAVFACFLLGFPINPLAPNAIENDIVHFFSKTKPKLLICDESILKTVQNAVNMMKSNAKIFTVMEDIKNYDSVTKILNRQSEEEFDYPEIDPNSIAAIIFSSGTTGPLKAILKTHKELIYGTDLLDFSKETSVIFQTSAIFWITGFQLLIYSTIHRFTRVITAQPYHPKHFADILKDYKISMVIPAPFAVSNMIQSGFLKQLDDMKFWVLGGEQITKKLIDDLQPFAPNSLIASMYGCTENMLVSINIHGVNNGSCGQPVLNANLKIVDDNGNTLDNFQHGEIYIKKVFQLNEYFEEPEITKESFENGWFKTGDIGYFDDEGFLYFVDRKKDIIRYGILQTFPSELEKIIDEIEGVVSSCVVGVYDQNISGDKIFAFVIVDKSKNLTEAQIENMVNSKVIDQKKIRGGVHFVEKFPLGKTGKVDKKVMKVKAKEIMERK
ncbi:hypothetical protein PVAND_012430 [Polypedilum vanderplanki]|uniref:Uncharacterized protein n=1 Tax=Polypedilum vanderplanki TaxID=319348 RepID=A0A9J6CLI5_POLVA|nr:hypothetical protein PVAND_012430 [Polypedilum vanderplanki]